MAQVLKGTMAQPQASPKQQPGPPLYMGPAGGMMPPYPPHPYAGMQGPMVPPQQPQMAQTAPVNPQPPQPTGNGVAPPPAATNGAEQNTEIPNENTENLANTKEKTPMCLINELARFNKIQHQYTLTDESGPAHKKVFYVKLKLGQEEYAASGPSIKKAQHAAADQALHNTMYKHPLPKPVRRQNGVSGNSVPDSLTPTVLLNALVMRRGEPAVYHHIEMPRPNYNRPANLDFRGMYNQRYHYPRYPRVFYVSLKVGQREFIGMGNSRQAARHDAASKALQVLQNLPMPTEADRQQMAAQQGEQAENDNKEDEDALKSEISLVFEIALKRNFSVNFEVIRESGPPHMRTFVTRCTVDRFVSEAEGNSKKVSKKRAAEKMLAELQALPALQPTVIRPKRAPLQKKKKRNLIKAAGGDAGNGEQQLLPRTDPNYGLGINPISRLIQIQQAKKEKEPVYNLVAERGVPRRREFVMQVQVGDKTSTGSGPNKKLAKRNAAEAMLQLLGYSRPSPQPGKPAIKSADSQVATPGDKKVTFIDQDGNTSRQLVPGVLLMPDGARPHGSYNAFAAAQGNLSRPSGMQPMPSQYNTHTMTTIARELLDTGMSMTAEALGKVDMKPNLGQPARPKHNLCYLADVMGLQLQFTDFPKGNNKNEFLSLVSLSTTPPQVSHGAGATIDDSHDMAALTALRAIAEMGLDKKTDNMAAGDGAHISGDMDKRVKSEMGH